MTKKLDIEKFRKLLLKEKEQILADRRTSAQNHSEDGIELSDYDNHPADAASETFEKTREYALDANFRQILESIDEALRKIDEGTYGICDRCGEPINVERLKAIPYATLCIECQESIERR
jgi:RNA polymerase-binding protein DksA